MSPQRFLETQTGIVALDAVICIDEIPATVFYRVHLDGGLTREATLGQLVQVFRHYKGATP